MFPFVFVLTFAKLSNHGEAQKIYLLITYFVGS
jgi:hypothetical protein